MIKHLYCPIVLYYNGHNRFICNKVISKGGIFADLCDDHGNVRYAISRLEKYGTHTTAAELSNQVNKKNWFTRLFQVLGRQ